MNRRSPLNSSVVVLQLEVMKKTASESRACPFGGMPVSESNHGSHVSHLIGRVGIL